MPVLLREADKDKEFFIELGDGSGKEGVFACVLSDNIRDELRRKHTTQIMNRNGIREELNATAFFHERLQRSIKRWVGFTDLSGKEIPCTAETIKECAEYNPAVFLDVVSALDRLATTGKLISEKNSKGGPA
jgi:hypothetical protein